MSNRTKIFLIGYFIFATLAFIALIILASQVPYFAVDLQITLFVQLLRNPPFDFLMHFISAPAFYPQTLILDGSIVLILFLAKMRWHAISILIVGSIVGGSATLLRMLIDRPRPAPHLVDVAQVIEEGRYSFPSGHVVGYVAIFGFLLYLAWVMLEPSRLKPFLAIAYASIIILVGISRVYTGEHWASDVLGSYLYGSIGLLAMILFYEWGKARFLVN